MNALIRLVISLTTCWIAVLGLSGCATHNLFESRGRSSTYKTFYLPDSSQYRIRRDDKLTISVWNNDDFSVGSLFSIQNTNEQLGKWVMVDVNGEIPVPRVGRLYVQGLTILQLRQLIQREYSKWLVNPIVDIRVLNREVTVLGEVRLPGRYPLEKEVNRLVELIGRAGDFDIYANRRKVKVIRTLNNQTNTIDLDLTQMSRFAFNNIQILPGDVVYVPSVSGKAWDRRATAGVAPIISTVTTLLLLARFLFQS